MFYSFYHSEGTVYALKMHLHVIHFILMLKYEEYSWTREYGDIQLWRWRFIIFLSKEEKTTKRKKLTESAQHIEERGWYKEEEEKKRRRKGGEEEEGGGEGWHRVDEQEQEEEEEKDDERDNIGDMTAGLLGKVIKCNTTACKR